MLIALSLMAWRQLITRLRQTKRRSQPRRRTWLIWPVAGLLVWTLIGCSATTGGRSTAPTALSLPSTNDVVPAAPQRPAARIGEDLGILAARFKDYGDESAAKLEQARQNYEAVRSGYGQPSGH